MIIKYYKCIFIKIRAGHPLRSDCLMIQHKWLPAIRRHHPWVLRPSAFLLLLGPTAPIAAQSACSARFEWCSALFWPTFVKTRRGEKHGKCNRPATTACHHCNESSRAQKFRKEKLPCTYTTRDSDMPHLVCFFRPPISDFSSETKQKQSMVERCWK